MSRPSGRRVAAPASGWRRWLRVGALGGSSFALAVGAHVAAGGGAPTAWLSVVAVVLLGLAAVVVTRRRQRLPALLVLLGAQQVALHLLMSLGDGASAMCAPAGHGHHDMVMTCVGDGAAMALPSVPMLLAHAGATLATAWVLSRGEAWLWRVLRRVFARPSPVCVPGALRLVTPGPVHLSPATRQTRPAVPRGPPAPAALLPA